MTVDEFIAFTSLDLKEKHVVDTADAFQRHKVFFFYTAYESTLYPIMS